MFWHYNLTALIVTQIFQARVRTSNAPMRGPARAGEANAPARQNGPARAQNKPEYWSNPKLGVHELDGDDKVVEVDRYAPQK